MFISRGLVGPKVPPNRRNRKGSRLKFLHQFIFCPVPDTSGLVEHSCLSVALSDKSVEYRNGENRTKLLGGGVFRFCVSLVSVKRELESCELSVPRSDTGAPRGVA